MCLIVDANCFACVFNPNSKYHRAFEPVFNWVMFGNGGGLIYGGKKYKTEVDFRTSAYRGIIAEIERRGRLHPMPDAKVDAWAAKVKAIANNADFDDEHIVALVAVSKCCVVCTNDKRSFPFLRQKRLYPDGVKPPKIYQTLRNADLCCKKDLIADVCRK